MTIRYKLDELATGQSDMNKGATQLDDILEDMGGQIRPLIERFVGSAASAYYASQATWDGQAAERGPMVAHPALEPDLS